MQQLKVIKLGVPEPWEKLPGSGLPGLSPPPLAARHRSWETALTIPHCSPRAGRHGPAQRPSQRALQGITRPGKQFPSQLSPDLPEAMQEGLFILFKGFSYSSVGKESAYNAGVPQFDSWVGKIHWRRDRLPTPVFWPGEFRRLYSSWGRKESDTTERLSLHFHGVLRPPDLAPEKSVFLRKSGQEATVRTGHGTTDWFQIGEEVRQVCILSPCLFDLCRVHHVKCGVG